MLPPLNLADSKGSFFSRKRVDGGESSGSSSSRRRGSIKIMRPSPRASIHEPAPRGSRTTEGDNEDASKLLSPCEDGRDLTAISMIPREFFVVETNAVVVPQNYPPNQYKSTLNAQGEWETVMFPALTPHNRQQVLYLRQTLDKMRANMPRFEKKGEDVVPETETDMSVLTERRRLMVEYTSQETQIYSHCFHELARQIKCICKEQSELLYEIRQRYDAAVARLLDQVKRLGLQSNQQQDQLSERTAQLKRSQDEAQQLVQKVQELEHQVKAGPSVATAQEALKLRKPFRKKRPDELSEEQESDHEDDSASEIDEEEAEWRRQRDASSVSRPSISSKHDSIKELHLAATRLQGAFQKYQARKEQTRITIRVEKQAAAMYIQRSYRGFRERQFVLHRRAVMRTIMRRREENAAVELMQANVRSYLLNRRRSAKLKLSFVSGLKVSGESSRALVTPSPVAQNPMPVEEVATPAMNESNDENATTKNVAESETANNEAKPNAKEALIRLLKTFRELASVITMLHHGEGRSVKSEEGGDIREAATLADDQNALPSRPSSVAPSDAFDDEDVELFQQTMQEAQALVGSLHVVLGTVPEEKSVSDGAELSQSDSSPDLNTYDAAQTDLLNDLEQQTQNDEDDIGIAQQPDVDEGSALDEYDDSSRSVPFGERDAMRLQNYAELHLDDSLWSSAMYYPATRNDTKQTEALLALALSSREQRKRLVTLKQFISDIYDAIVGKLKELPRRRVAEMISSRCHLALSFAEWHQQRSQLFSRAVAADQPGELPIPVSFSIEKLTREHFRCRLGLPQLIDAALANLHESVEDFAAIDPDVKRFQEFLFNERSEEELVFCCMCRYICAHGLQTDESPAGSASPTYQRQPMFHPTTMREVIDTPHALELAKLLFRVDDESSIIESDRPFTEVENLVYRQYLPTNGYQQFEAIVSSFFVDPDSQAAAVTSINDAEDAVSDAQALVTTCRRPVGSPRHASAMVRPTNYNQFHSKQYNAQAARSPVVRRQQPRTSQWWSPRSTGDKWLYFEEVLALLVKYRGEMNHFHLFSYWVQELFNLAAASSSDTSVKLLDDAAFVETLTPLSLGPTERELKNIFHNSLRQRKLHVLMPLRVFTSVALLLLRNGLLSVSTYAPLRRQNHRDGDDSNAPDTRQRSLSIREENEEKEWRVLALKWRTQEAAFEAAIEAIYHESPSFFMPDHSNDASTSASVDKTRAAHALQLLQLRQELYDLFASRSGRGRDLKRAYEIYEILVNERLARVGGDTRMLDAQLGSTPSLGAWSTASFALS